MIPLIHKLPNDLINKIAAGEVVERPASVVKELVENSLDAGATQIDITIRDGGKKLIQVSDDGCGIPHDQLSLAIARHASSKIATFDDIYALKTKGFRGEALASICSVAKVSLASCHGDSEAHEVFVDEGEIVDERVCAHPRGTTVTVKYLFHKTPARLKFLKSSETETTHIEREITKLALCHPSVGFCLRQDNKELLKLDRGQTLRERVLAVLGKDLADDIFPFGEQQPKIAVSGYFGHPQIARSQRSFGYFFVNARPVNDKVIWHAVMEAYRDLLMRGKYPVLVLNLQIDEHLIDVNVHPTKAEVRFHQSQQVHQIIKNTLRKFLSEAPWLSRRGEGFSRDVTQDFGVVSDSFAGRLTPLASHSVADSLLKWSDRYFEQPAGDPVTTTFTGREHRVAEISVSSDAGKQIRFSRMPYAQMRVVGQILGSYLVCEAYDALFIIDQHAAHERIGFEKLLKEYEHKGIQKKPLLISETFDLKPSDAALLKEYTDELNAFGFEIDFFGGNTFVLKAVPQLPGSQIDIAMFVGDLVEDIKETGEMVSLKTRFHAVLARIACHAQIRAGHHLEPQEIQQLLSDLDQHQFTDFCPHGRPVCVTVTKDEIEKWFKRVV